MCSECGNLTLGAVFREIGRQPTEGNGMKSLTGICRTMVRSAACIRDQWLF
jgi:hypothetical protein